MPARLFDVSGDQRCPGTDHVRMGWLQRPEHDPAGVRAPLAKYLEQGWDALSVLLGW
jgi:hypothetical protein